MYAVWPEVRLEYFRHVSSVFKYSFAPSMRFGRVKPELVRVHTHWSSAAADSCVEDQLGARGT